MNIVHNQYDKLSKEYRLLSSNGDKSSVKIWGIRMPSGLYHVRGLSCADGICSKTLRGDVCLSHPVHADIAGFLVGHESFLFKIANYLCTKHILRIGKRSIGFDVHCYYRVPYMHYFLYRRLESNKKITVISDRSYTVKEEIRRELNGKVIPLDTEKEYSFIHKSCVIKVYRHRNLG